MPIERRALSERQQPIFPLPSDGSQSGHDSTAASSYPFIGGQSTTTSAAPSRPGKSKGSEGPTPNTRALLIFAGAAAVCVTVVAVTFALTRGADDAPATADYSSYEGDQSSENRSGPGWSSDPTSADTLPTAARPAPRPDASRVALNVSVPISQPDCDGSGIVVLRSAVTPGNYGAEIQRYLNEFPGSSYLRTDHSCPSLRQSTDSGSPIYAVYHPAGRTEAEICSAVRRAGGDAYGKRLDMTTDPRYMITC